MTAIDAPSDDQRGCAICSGGFQRERASPLAASTTYSSAVQ